MAKQPRTREVPLRKPLARQLRIKMMIGLVLLLVGVIFATVVPLYIAINRQIVVDIKRELRAITATAALHIDGDAHRQFTADPDTDSPAFARLRDGLMDVRNELNLPPEHIYTFYRDPADPAIVRFGVMTQTSPFTGDPYPLRQEMLATFERGEVVVTDLYTDDNGAWLSGYAPIRDSAGKVVAILEVDRRPGAFAARFNRALWFAGTIAVTGLIGGMFFARWMLRRLVGEPIDRIHTGVTALARRDFSHRINLETGDELQDLGDAIDDVVGQLDAARTVHASLIPTDLPAGHGWELAGASVPCDATAGDYYDAFELPGGRIGVAIGDVTGHGLGPSLLMSTCRSALHAICESSEGAESPGVVLDRLARVCANDLKNGKFITLIYGVLEPDGRFTYANAGHGPTLVRQNGRPPTRLTTHRLPLGIHWEAPDGETTEEVIQLEPGDRLLLASDGVTEAHGETGMYGETRLKDDLAEAGDAQAFVSRLLDRLTQFTAGRTWRDDVTILCIDRT